jgi:hypothetical protein
MRSYLRGWPALAAALSASFAAISCTSDHAPAAGSSPLAPADADIATLLYAGSPRMPIGFASDPPPPSYSQVTTYHIKSAQLAPPAHANYEVCTDDWNTALAWSEEVAAQANPYLDLVVSDTTARYFEFGRVPRGLPGQYVRQRVFRCAYLDRAGVDLAAPGSFAGVLNARPLDAAALRDLAEYLWLFTSYNNAGHVVLASEASLPGPAHTLTLATLERGGTCDRVTVREWTHGADASSGALQLTVEVDREFGVRELAGVPVGC